MRDSSPPAKSPTETAGFKFPELNIYFLSFYFIKLPTSTNMSSKTSNRHYTQTKGKRDLKI